MASTYQLLDKAEQLELLAEQIYLAMAGRFAGEHRALFQRLAGEEAQHAARIRLLAARYRQDRRLVNSVSADVTQLERLLVEAREALAAVNSGAWDGNPEAALAAALELEHRFCLAHAHALSSGAQPELRAFFEQLASQDKAHEALLKGGGTRNPVAR